MVSTNAHTAHSAGPRTPETSANAIPFSFSLHLFLQETLFVSGCFAIFQSSQLIWPMQILSYIQTMPHVAFCIQKKEHLMFWHQNRVDCMVTKTALTSPSV